MVCAVEDKIPLSVLVVTKNEARRIARCIQALHDFSDVIVIDSNSIDKTMEIARDMGCEVVPYHWDGRYPKKRQWCLDRLPIKHDWVFWVDADEIVTPQLTAEIRELFSSVPTCAGYFVKGRYLWRGKVLQHGLYNNKLALFDRRKMCFPVVDDLECPAIGEIEGHYQPVFRQECHGEALGQIKASLLHYAYDDKKQWAARHERYALWEAHMNHKCAWPCDPVFWRERVKRAMRRSMFRGWAMFLYSYVLKFGFLDGEAGYLFALSRKHYCDMVLRAMRR